MKNNKKKTIIFVILLIVIAFLTVGYALLSTTLNILGNTTVSGNTWNIHWANVQVTEGSTTENTKEAIITSPTQVEFSISLDKPGDFYEFTVDAVNEGTIDGMIDIISTNVYQSNGTTPATLPSAITYSITYDDGMEIEQNHLLPANATETYRVRVEYKRDIENSELLTTNETYVFRIMSTFDQANDDAIIHQTPGVLLDYDESAGCATITTDSSGGGGNASMSGLTLMMKNATQGEDNPSWFTNSAQNQSQTGVYTRKGTGNDKFPIYYYRGTSTVNNNLIFNNYCWKIIRTTATGGIRIIYNGPASNGECTTQTGSTTVITTSETFNTLYDDAKYVKYVYDNNGTPTNSNLKTILENWYNTNMRSIDSKIETSVYCNDTSKWGTAEYIDPDVINANWGDYRESAEEETHYCPLYRIIKGIPTTLCSKKSDAYKLKVGFLTVDEEVLAGRSWNNGKQNYLYNGDAGAYWLGSPFYFYFSDARMFVFGYDSYVGALYSIRPVITLLPNTAYTGTGTKTKPFVVN